MEVEEPEEALLESRTGHAVAKAGQASFASIAGGSKEQQQQGQGDQPQSGREAGQAAPGGRLFGHIIHNTGAGYESTKKHILIQTGEGKEIFKAMHKGLPRRVAMARSYQAVSFETSRRPVLSSKFEEGTAFWALDVQVLESPADVRPTIKGTVAALSGSRGGRILATTGPHHFQAGKTQPHFIPFSPATRGMDFTPLLGLPVRVGTFSTTGGMHWSRAECITIDYEALREGFDRVLTESALAEIGKAFPNIMVVGSAMKARGDTLSFPAEWENHADRACKVHGTKALRNLVTAVFK